MAVDHALPHIDDACSAIVPECCTEKNHRGPVSFLPRYGKELKEVVVNGLRIVDAHLTSFGEGAAAVPRYSSSTFL